MIVSHLLQLAIDDAGILPGSYLHHYTFYGDNVIVL